LNPHNNRIELLSSDNTTATLALNGHKTYALYFLKQKSKIHRISSTVTHAAKNGTLAPADQVEIGDFSDKEWRECQVAGGVRQVKPAVVRDKLA